MLNSCRAVFELSSLSSPVRNTSAALLSTYVEASETLVHRPGSERSSRINGSPFVVSFVNRIQELRQNLLDIIPKGLQELKL